MSVYKGKGDRALPDEAFRACFCIFRVTVWFDKEELVVYEEPAPNSIRVLYFSVITPDALISPSIYLKECSSRYWHLKI